MSELSSKGTARGIGTSREAISLYLNRDLLPTMRQGLRGIICIDTDDLKSFSKECGFRYQNQLTANLSE